MTAYTLTVETVGQKRMPVVVAEGDLRICGWCDELYPPGAVVWVFPEQTARTPGEVCCTACMLASRDQDRVGRGSFRVVGVRSA